MKREPLNTCDGKWGRSLYQSSTVQTTRPMRREGTWTWNQRGMPKVQTGGWKRRSHKVWQGVDGRRLPGLVCEGEGTRFGVRAGHEVWSRKEKAVAELRELWEGLPHQARIRGRCLELNYDWECWAADFWFSKRLDLWLVYSEIGLF